MKMDFEEMLEGLSEEYPQMAEKALDLKDDLMELMGEEMELPEEEEELELNLDEEPEPLEEDELELDLEL